MILFSRGFARKCMIPLVTAALVAAASFAFAEDPPGTDRVRAAMPIQYVADRPDHPEEQAFLSENRVAMNRMMADMMIKPSGDVDRDFVEMMIPHHEGAVDMAQAELKYGHNEQLRRLAREIVANQQREIAVMRNAVSDGRSSAVQLPEQPAAPATGPVAGGGMRMSR
jgi:hypothetical protein